jgi:hypothetical protein
VACDLGEQADPDRPFAARTTTVTRVNVQLPRTAPFSDSAKRSATNDPGIHRPAAACSATRLQRPPSRARCSRRAHAADCLAVLLARGAKRDLRDDRGLTAAEIARQTNHADVAEAIAKP